jgi:hypothetical protein
MVKQSRVLTLMVKQSCVLSLMVLSSGHGFALASAVSEGQGTRDKGQDKAKQTKTRLEKCIYYIVDIVQVVEQSYVERYVPVQVRISAEDLA